LTRWAFEAGIGWLALVFWLGARGLTHGRRKRFLLTALMLALLVAIAVLVHGCR
jgi:hypothetical protein